MSLYDVGAPPVHDSDTQDMIVAGNTHTHITQNLSLCRGRTQNYLRNKLNNYVDWEFYVAAMIRNGETHVSSNLRKIILFDS